MKVKKKQKKEEEEKDKHVTVLITCEFPSSISSC